MLQSSKQIIIQPLQDVSLDEIAFGRSSAQQPSGDHVICNMVMKTIVDVAMREYFEKEWHLDIYESMSACKGFLYRSTNIINVENGKVEYVTIIGFDSLENLRLWISSGARKRHMEEAKAHSFLVFYINENGGSSDELMVEDMSFKEKRTDQCTLISRNDMANAAFVPRPPPKWKLFCIIWFGVYFAVLLEGFSGLSGLLASFGLPLYMLLFISLSHSVSILSFTFFPLLMSTSLVSKWLKATRPPPDQMSDIAKIFDMGLDMFTEIGALDAPSILERLQKLEGKVEKLKKINHDLSNKISDMQSTQLELKEAPETDNLTALEEGMNASVVTDESESDSTADVVGLSVEYRGKIVSDSGVTPPSTKPAPFLGKLQESSSYFSTRFSRKDIFKSYFSIDTAENITIKNSAKANNPSARESRSLSQNQNNMPLTLSVRNRVKWERTIDYEKWLNDMTKEMSRHAGFYGMATIQVPKEDNTYINTFSFDSYDHLTSFISSKQRKKLLKRLESMLMGASVSEVTEEHSFQAVFDELFVATGGKASISHPPVWKTTMLVILPLFFFVWCVATGLSPVLLFQVGLPQEVVTLISTCITVLVNTYFGVPIMHLVFGKWHRRHRKTINRNSWTSFFDLGLSQQNRVLVLSCYVSLLLCMGFGLIF